MTLDQQVVWNYVNPIGSFGATAQYDNPAINGVFRAERYAAAHPALAGRDLVAQGLLEISLNPPACTVLYPEPSCAADLNGNYFVEVNDLLGMLTGFGCTGGCPGDLDGDGSIGISDLLVLLEHHRLSLRL